MKARWAAPLLVLGVARAALAGEVAPLPPPVEPLIAVPLSVPAPPPPEKKGDLAPVAGALTAFVPFVVGAALWSDDDNRQLSNVGTYIMASGFAAAPWVAHGLHGRWKRAAAYGSISAALSAATLIAMEVKDPFVPEVKNRDRVPFGVLLTTAMFAGALGVIDSFVVGPKDGE